MTPVTHGRRCRRPLSMSERPRCPYCRRPLPAPSGEEGTWTRRWPHFPFCSRRCRLLDLDNWLQGSYRIPGEEVDPDEASPGEEA